MFKITDVQETPNPDALKFILDSQLLAIGVRQFDDKKSAQGDTLAQPLFALGDVMSVFYADNFVTVTKFPELRWKDVQPKIEKIIGSTQIIIENVNPAGATAKTSTPEEQELLKKINTVLDNNVRPALAGDGGGLQVLGLEGTTLWIHYQGACGSCPSASAGTMNAIQNLLRRMVDPRLTVAAG